MIGDSSVNQIVAALEQTLQFNQAVRQAGEQTLGQLEKVPGYTIHLLQLVVNEAAPAEIRIAAAIAVKNFIKRNWSETPDIEISGEEEDRIRELILQCMFASKANLQNQLSHALQLMAMRDFPERWPNLVPTLTQFLAGDNVDQMIATLSAMDQLFKKFRIESKSNELWVELKTCLLTVQEPLTALFVRMATMNREGMGADVEAQWLVVLHLAVKIFHSLSFQDLPEYFEDNIEPWMSGFLSLMKVDCPAQKSTSGEPTTQDKMKSEICRVFTLYAQRYDEETKKFMELIIECVWQTIESASAETRYDTLVCAALEFLALICTKATYESIFAQDGVLSLLANQCVKNLSFREQDQELFEDEPLDYMRRDLEGVDMLTRRRGATDLVRALCKRFEPALVPILSQIVQTLCANNEWKNQDVVYCLVTAMASKTETAKSGAISTSQLINIKDYYMNNVRAHLTSDINEYPILKADAFKFVVTFRNHLPVEVLVEVMSAADRMLSANLPILHKYAAYVIDKLLLMRDPSTNQPVLTAAQVPVATVLSNLVAGFDKDSKAQSSPYLIKAIMRVVSILDESTARHAGDIAVKLSLLVDEATKNPADAVHTHFLFETMCVLIRKTVNLPNGSLDSHLMPLVETILSKDLVDLIPYAIQITGMLLSAAVSRGVAPDQYISFLPHLLSIQLWSRSANIPAALTVLELYLKYSGDRVIADKDSVLLIMTHLNRLINSKSLEIYGFQLASALLPLIENPFAGVDSAMRIVFSTMFTRYKTTKTPRFVKLFIVFLCRFAVVRGAPALVAATEAIQPGIFSMLVERVLCIEIPNIHNLTIMEEKRIVAIGCANMFADTAPQLGNCYGQLANVVAGLIESSSFTEKQNMSPEEEQASMYNAEGEFTNPYCRLSHVPKTEQVAAQITNHKKYLAEAVVVRGPATSAQCALGQEAEQYYRNLLSV